MKKILLTSTVLGICSSIFGQVGINTPSPQASFHMEAAITGAPLGEDGILIPRLNDYPTNPQKKGLLIFLQNHPTDSTGFYYWDGEDWKSLIIDTFSRTEEKSMYVCTGSGYSGTGGVAERTVQFSNFTSNDPTGFSVSNNGFQIGKAGKYHLSFNSALKKGTSTPVYRATYVYRIKVNGVLKASSSISIPNESETASGVSTSTLLDLDVGDIITVTVQKNNEGHSHNLYTGYGTNSLVLTYLN